MHYPPFLKHTTTALLVSVCLFFGLALTPVSSAQAEQVKSAEPSVKKSKRKVRRAQTMRAKIFKKLDHARELSDNKQYDQALEALELVKKIRRNSYETAMTWNMVAYVYFNQEHYDQAISAYQQVLATKKLPASIEQTTLYSLAKLYMVQEEYQQALSALNNWFSVTDKPGAQAYVLRAQMQYQLKHYTEALPDIKTAIKLVKAKGKQPKENWLLVERAIYFNNKNFKSMEGTLKELITLYPKPQYWMQLSAVYNELGLPEKELSVMETAYDQSLLKNESQVVSLAQAMLALDVPYKSAQIMIDGIKNKTVKENGKNLSLLGDAFMIAKEYQQAIKVMAQAANLTQQGKDFYKLAQIYTERQEWNSALKNVSSALLDEQFSHIEDALILKGLILFNLDQLAQAKQVFEEAKEFKETQKAANQWLVYINGETKRRSYMALQTHL
jgi:tetratricopeptide (TPR) repeat protein